ncbi:MAG: LysE family translocator [Kiritimatiellales bacterium]|nr:LysE family translocator [Kiritimatiellales bacterium]
MVSLLTIFAGAFVVGLSGAMAPGPVLTVTISETLKRGFKAGPLIVLGHAILEIILLILIVAGLGPFFEQPIVARFFSVVGGIVLLGMGGHMVATNRKTTDEAMRAEGNTSSALRNPVTAGILLSISNPYWIIWWATIGLGFVTQSLQYGLIGLLSFYLGHIMADLVWYCFVSFSVTAGRRFCAPVIYRVVFIVCGAAMVGLGVFFLSSAF